MVTLLTYNTKELWNHLTAITEVEAIQLTLSLSRILINQLQLTVMMKSPHPRNIMVDIKTSINQIPTTVSTADLHTKKLVMKHRTTMNATGILLMENINLDRDVHVLKNEFLYQLLPQNSTNTSKHAMLILLYKYEIFSLITIIIKCHMIFW